jgi:hypothetical protein
MTRNRHKLAGVVAGLAAAVLGLGLAFSGSGHGPSPEAMARQTAREFFQTIDARRYDRACNLLAAQFYRENHVPDKARCALALRIGFTWAPSYRFRIVGVRVDRNRAVVEALANGAPGEVMHVKEHGWFKVVSVGSK